MMRRSYPNCLARSRSPTSASIPNRARFTFVAGTSIPESSGTVSSPASLRASAMIASESIRPRNRRGHISPTGTRRVEPGDPYPNEFEGG